MMDRGPFLEQLTEATDQGVWLIGPDGTSYDVNPAMCRMLGRERNVILASAIFDFVDEENKAIFEYEIASRAAGKSSSRYEISLQQPDGTLVRCINNANSVWDAEGVRVGSIGIWTDITEIEKNKRELLELKNQLAEKVSVQNAELERSNERLKAAHKAARMGAWETNEAGDLRWSTETLEIFGLTKEKFSGKLEQFHDLIHPEDRERVIREATYARQYLDHYTSNHRIVRPDGSIRHVQESAAVIRNFKGIPVCLSGAIQDVTERVELEAHFRQSQKIETIGQLSGGIAHDFNNILSVIVGAAGLLEMDRTYDAELVQSIMRSADRGADLTHRLLAYARQQPLRTVHFDVRKLVLDMTSMLRRVVGIDIQISTEMSEKLWLAAADPAPLEDALLNLTVNARDAMPEGGQIVIKCKNVCLNNEENMPTDYVQIVVKDTGTGMTEDVKAKATDPFYTTKARGQGTGLGLSMIEGYVRQSNGHMVIQSDPGNGTAITLRLPRAKQG
jgi:PAS domain S-box-containing protein